MSVWVILLWNDQSHEFLTQENFTDFGLYGPVRLIYLHMVNLNNIATYGSVWLILQCMGQFDLYCHIRVSLTDIVMYGSIWLILPPTYQFDQILQYMGQFDSYSYIRVSFNDFTTNSSVWLILPHMGQFYWLWHI